MFFSPIRQPASSSRRLIMHPQARMKCTVENPSRSARRLEEVLHFGQQPSKRNLFTRLRPGENDGCKESGAKKSARNAA